MQATHAVMVRVADVDAPRAQAKAAGAVILAEPADQPYGERQYSARDPGGHLWTFSRSIADIAQQEWGGRMA
ncbi:MAG: glyoxalase [Betaproteobacteria bacterium]|nr:glyoxalase [Betaproteobacteria bacterium]